VSSTQERPSVRDGTPDGARPKLVFIRSETSGRSRRVEGFLAQVLQRRHNHDTFDIVWVDADAHSQLVERLGIEAAPALVVVHDGRVQARLAAPRGCRSIHQFLEPWLK
jgi:thioredoxin-like negative regulator of GroEL